MTGFFTRYATFALAGVAIALLGSPAEAQTIYACLDKNGDLDRVTTKGQPNCKHGQTPIKWNMQGPPGPQGPQGIQGPQGVPGPAADSRKLVFVTFGLYSPPFSGGRGAFLFEVADAICNQEAARTPLPGTYVAWLSNTVFDARERISRGSYYRVDGVRVAKSWSQLLSGPLEAPINTGSGGAPLAPQAPDVVWTGTTAYGRYPSGASPDSANCNSWNGSEGSQGALTGRANRVESDWTQFSSEPCNTTARLYCFQE